MIPNEWRTGVQNISIYNNYLDEASDFFEVLALITEEPPCK